VNSNIRFPRLIVVVFLIRLVAPAFSGEKTAHILVADYVNDNFAYTVDGHVPEQKDGLLLALSRAREADRSPHPAITILVHERAKLSDVYNLIGIVIKTDYASYRVFTFKSDKRVMTEITFASAVPFAASGAIAEQEPSSAKH
jgi:hypothetical protein